MKFLKHILSLFFFLGILLQPAEAKVIGLLNQNYSFSFQTQFSTNTKETNWLGLLYLDENAKLTIHPNGAGQTQETQKFFKKPGLVDSWNILKNTGLKTDVKWLEKISD